MTSTQMRTAIFEIHQGRSFKESTIPKSFNNKVKWDELKEEIEQGFSIDCPQINLFKSKRA